MATFVIGTIVLILFGLAVNYVRKNGACQEDCSRCHGVCDHNSGPSFYERYRKDHPKVERS